jgi:hypothetical protein
MPFSLFQNWNFYIISYLKKFVKHFFKKVFVFFFLAALSFDSFIIISPIPSPVNTFLPICILLQFFLSFYFL